MEQFIQDVADEFCSNEESCNKELGNGESCDEKSSNETSSDKKAGDEESRDEESVDKDEVISYLSDIFMVSHVRIINECHELVDLFCIEYATISTFNEINIFGEIKRITIPFVSITNGGRGDKYSRNIRTNKFIQ